MFWIIVLAVGFAMTFTALGAYSVWLKVLVAALKVALWLVGILTLAFVWKRIFRKASATPNSIH